MLVSGCAQIGAIFTTVCNQKWLSEGKYFSMPEARNKNTNTTNINGEYREHHCATTTVTAASSITSQ